MTERVPIDYVEGVEDVTVWLWPDDPDPVTVCLPHDDWNRLQRKADEIGDGDVGRVVRVLLEQQLE